MHFVIWRPTSTWQVQRRSRGKRFCPEDICTSDCMGLEGKKEEEGDQLGTCTSPSMEGRGGATNVYEYILDRSNRTHVIRPESCLYRFCTKSTTYFTVWRNATDNFSMQIAILCSLRLRRVASAIRDAMLAFALLQPCCLTAISSECISVRRKRKNENGKESERVETDRTLRWKFGSAVSDFVPCAFDEAAREGASAKQNSSDLPFRSRQKWSTLA